MSYRALAFAVAAFASVHAANAADVYVAPGGVYVGGGGGPVYVTPAPNNGPYVRPGYGYDQPPPVAAPTGVYGPNGGYYDGPDGGYYGGGYYGGGYYNGGYNGGGYYREPLSVYAGPPRPPAPVPSYRRSRCADPYGYGGQYCY